MSVKVSAWVWHEAETSISGNELVVLLALADIADDHGNCTYVSADGATQAALAKKARVHKATFIRWVEKLQQRGIVEVTKGRQHLANSYRIVMNQGSHSATSAKSSSRSSGVQRSQSVDAEVAVREGTPSIDVSNVVNVFTTSSEPSGSDIAEGSSSGAKAAKVFDPEIVRLANLLAELVVANGHQVGVIGSHWLLPIDRLMRLDGYSAHQVEWMIHWSTTHEFWAANIRSPRKLRESFSTLVAQAKRDAERAKQERAKQRPMSNAEQNLARFIAKQGGGQIEQG